MQRPGGTVETTVDNRYLRIEGLDRNRTIFQTRVEQGQLCEDQVRDLLRALAGKAPGRTYHEIVTEHLNSGTTVRPLSESDFEGLLRTLKAKSPLQGNQEVVADYVAQSLKFASSLARWVASFAYSRESGPTFSACVVDDQDNVVTVQP